MYKIIGADGKEYGPVTPQELRQWIAEGRVNEQTSVRLETAADWRPAVAFPEIAALFAAVRTAAAAPAPAPFHGFPPVEGPEQGMAVTSFVLGLLSLVCLGFLAGLPAIICGYLAHSRARNEPAKYGGAGFALAGLVLGYIGIMMSLVAVALLLPALSKAKGKAQTINCENNLKQVGLAIKIWAIDHNDEYPFNAGTNSGGTLELCHRGEDGFEQDPSVHFRILSEELSTPRILVCPADTTRVAGASFQSLSAANISYRLRTGTNVNENTPDEILVVCPVHGNILRSDGSVQRGSGPEKRP